MISLKMGPVLGCRVTKVWMRVNYPKAGSAGLVLGLGTSRPLGSGGFHLLRLLRGAAAWGLGPAPRDWVGSHLSCRKQLLKLAASF